MEHRLTISSQMWAQLRDHLLADHDEHLAFILAGHTVVDGEYVLLARDLVLIPDQDVEGGDVSCGLSLKLERLLDVMNQANRAGLALIEAHSHPFSTRHVAFSLTDTDGQQELAAYLAEALPGRPYGALVLGQDSVAGRLWPSGERRPSPLGEVRVLGDNLTRLLLGKSHNPRSRSREGKDTYDRQVLAIGEEGQAKLQCSKVAIVGLGGVGSVVAQQLAHLGVSEYILIDDDRVERSNLHRLVGATPSDVGALKVDVAARQINAINPTAKVTSIPSSVRSTEALATLKGSDVLFGCVDTDAARLILNELALAYIVPYIDCGVGILVGEEGLAEAGGKVSVWTPGRPCLLCIRDIHPEIAAEELESEEEREFRRQHGYVAGAHIPEPAVISLNSTVASIAVTEFLAFVVGIRPSHHYTYYDLLEGRVGPRLASRNSRCTACGLHGLGDRAGIERYSRVGLPHDLPAPGTQRPKGAHMKPSPRHDQ